MCASLACQVWLNISSLARRRRHRRATVRSMRLPSVIVKKGKVVLVVVATWEQQNISWKHHCIENSENIIGTIILHQLKKLIEKISSNPNGWQGIWSTTIETDREFFSLNCSVHCTTDSVRCAATDFENWERKKTRETTARLSNVVSYQSEVKVATVTLSK